jgi:SnoaL-like polyketide cyclase
MGDRPASPRVPRRKGVTGQPDNGRSVNRTSRLFGEGQAGNIALTDDSFSESTGVNGVIAGVAGPKRRLQEPLAGFPELSMHIVDMFSAGDKIVTRLVWRGLVPVHMGVAAASRPAAAAEFAAGAPRAAK